MSVLATEAVLVQAWKKTAAYIRDHNWYSDTLELDRTAANLPEFIRGLLHDFSIPHLWENRPLRIVPAPKSRAWNVHGPRVWQPRDMPNEPGTWLRPLSHVSLRDQVAATAVMLCLADRVESAQRDPTSDPTNFRDSNRVLSYGNRLFCDRIGGKLRHRWGSAKLYRGFYHDYRTFLARPDLIAQRVPDDTRLFVVHSDLRHFYDRVRPEMLAAKLSRLRRSGDDPTFFRFASNLLNWTWDGRDYELVRLFSQLGPSHAPFRVAIPQGLVAAGFFANVSLLDFDEALRNAIGTEISGGTTLVDACRYVDDLRLVVTMEDPHDAVDRGPLFDGWIQQILNAHAPGLETASNKTRIAAFRSEERPLIRQGRKMDRIQAAMSGGFDALAGEEILDAVQGLLRSQHHYSGSRLDEVAWSFAPIPDVRDATVARFAAGRFRTTYRSLRPLLDAVGDRIQHNADRSISRGDVGRGRRTQADLDDDARTFALGLIESWVADPANIRLLRIGLDLWPAVEVLSGVLDLLRPLVETPMRNDYPGLVASYSLAEIFRAAATETGFVEDQECFPDGIHIEAYRKRLVEEAQRVLMVGGVDAPWYLRQQVLLFLAVADPAAEPVREHRFVSDDVTPYEQLLQFLRGEYVGLNASEYAIFAILRRRSFGQTWDYGDHISARQLESVAERDPSFALEILSSNPSIRKDLSLRTQFDLCLDARTVPHSLAYQVLERDGAILRNELTLLTFARAFLKAYAPEHVSLAITPAEVVVEAEQNGGQTAVTQVEINPARLTAVKSIYSPPSWCKPTERWRFQLGYLLRFVLAQCEDFTARSYHIHQTLSYVPMRSNWYQRLYGLFNAQSAFGDDWLPISEFTEQLIYALLAWPGSLPNDYSPSVTAGTDALITLLDARIEELRNLWGKSTNLFILPMKVRRPTSSTKLRPFRACVVQTVVPHPDHDFDPSDLSFSKTSTRRRHRRHLSAALAAVKSMLELRLTHLDQKPLDLLILPELSVHPSDVRTHLVPFARAHKTIILAGLTYEQLSADQPLTNAALWVIPQWSRSHGMHTFTRRQGKQHLAPLEERLNSGRALIQGFRPCQWLIGYDWAGSPKKAPLWLTAAICYDATDLCLASDLRNCSDVFVVPALNQDVTTFDNMSMALHYHMYQLVIVANNGTYGGSSAYAPYRDPWNRQIFHLHGQPQSSIGFLEIENVEAFKNWEPDPPARTWKAPPAGLTRKP